MSFNTFQEIKTKRNGFLAKVHFNADFFFEFRFAFSSLGDINWKQQSSPYKDNYHK